jgi:hypothetical protein
MTTGWAIIRPNMWADMDLFASVESLPYDASRMRLGDFIWTWRYWGLYDANQ